jgi:hypothetical protein
VLRDHVRHRLACGSHDAEVADVRRARGAPWFARSTCLSGGIYSCDGCGGHLVDATCDARRPPGHPEPSRFHRQASPGESWSLRHALARSPARSTASVTRGPGPPRGRRPASAGRLRLRWRARSRLPQQLGDPHHDRNRRTDAAVQLRVQQLVAEAIQQVGTRGHRRG